MRVGFYLSAILTETHKAGVQGDEIWVNAIVKGLKELYPENEYYIFGENLGFMPETDVAIYFHQIKKKLGKKNIYVQQNYNEHPEEMKKIIAWYKDKEFVSTISAKYAKEMNWQFLFPAVDTDIFYPTKFSIDHTFDIFYAGSNIKLLTETDKLLSVPNVKYGVFGNGFNKNLETDKLKYYYSSSMLSLNIPFNSDYDVITAKPFQIALCKGIVITPETKSLREIFKDSIYLLDRKQDYHYQIRNIITELQNSQSIMLEKREKAYKIALEYNYKVQAKNFWEWVNKCLI